jgi:DNA-3-methyladenine glycosylase I
VTTVAHGDKTRCFGGPDDPLMMSYHDEEWGVPVHDDRVMFEFLTLEGFQAGLSWRTILHKREAFRRAFDNFDIEKIAVYSDADLERLMANVGIVRNRAKIGTTIGNARRVLDVRKELSSFERYIWQFTDGKTLRRHGTITMEDLPAQTPESEAMSKDMKARGFRFVGPTICYAHMQAVGMVNDHISDCFLAPE